jgi:hypothetical protein
MALAPFPAFLAQLLLVQIGLEFFIGKTTAETSSGNCHCRCNFDRPATRYHMPWAFRQRIAIRKRKPTTGRSTLMCHTLSYRDWLKSSNAEVTAENWGAQAATCWFRLPAETNFYSNHRAILSHHKPLMMHEFPLQLDLKTASRVSARLRRTELLMLHLLALRSR